MVKMFSVQWDIIRTKIVFFKPNNSDEIKAFGSVRSLKVSLL